jgi:hypothetical protein
VELVKNDRNTADRASCYQNKEQQPKKPPTMSPGSAGLHGVDPGPAALLLASATNLQASDRLASCRPQFSKPVKMVLGHSYYLSSDFALSGLLKAYDTRLCHFIDLPARINNTALRGKCLDLRR